MSHKTAPKILVRSDHARDKGIACLLFCQSEGMGCNVENCPYAHVTRTTRRNVPRARCRFYLLDRCRRDECTFFHGSEEDFDQLKASGAKDYCPIDFMPVRDPLRQLSLDEQMMTACALRKGLQVQPPTVGGRVELPDPRPIPAWPSRPPTNLAYPTPPWLPQASTAQPTYPPPPQQHQHQHHYYAHLLANSQVMPTQPQPVANFAVGDLYPNAVAPGMPMPSLGSAGVYYGAPQPQTVAPFYLASGPLHGHGNVMPPASAAPRLQQPQQQLVSHVVVRGCATPPSGSFAFASSDEPLSQPHAQPADAPAGYYPQMSYIVGPAVVQPPQPAAPQQFIRYPYTIVTPTGAEYRPQ